MPRMSEVERRSRAERLRVLRVVYKQSPADTWRAVNPGSKCNDDSAGQLARRELRWLDHQIEQENRAQDRETTLSIDFVALLRRVQAIQNDEVKQREERRPVEPQRKCMGVADRPCDAEIPMRQKRCRDCQRENRRRQKRRYNRTYFQANRVRLNEKRRGRWRRQRQQAALDAVVTSFRNEEARRAALPRVVVEPGKRPYLFHPLTGKKEPL